jgi:hypothetical protein
MTITTKDLYTLVNQEIDKRNQFQNSKTFRNQLDRVEVQPLIGSNITDVRASDLIDLFKIC